MTRIIVPTDFTKAADTAVKQAVAIALKTKAGLILLHVVDDKSPSIEKSEKTLKEQTKKISAEYGLMCDYLLKEGNIFDLIAEETNKTAYDLMVIGTHGIKGMRQKIFGADLLKVVSKVIIPALVVQEDSPLINDFRKIILPVSSHDCFDSAVNAVMLLSGISDAEVYLYSINKPGFEFPDQMKTNIDHAMNLFKTNNIKVTRIKEDQTVYSPGYAKQTLRYARSVNADGICVVSISSNEYYYFAQADKDHMLENESRIPVLFAGGGN